MVYSLHYPADVASNERKDLPAVLCMIDGMIKAHTTDDDHKDGNQATIYHERLLTDRRPWRVTDPSEDGSIMVALVRTREKRSRFSHAVLQRRPRGST